MQPSFSLVSQIHMLTLQTYSLAIRQGRTLAVLLGSFSEHWLGMTLDDASQDSAVPARTHDARSKQ